MGAGHYERLEFLGDRILGQAVSHGACSRRSLLMIKASFFNQNDFMPLSSKMPLPKSLILLGLSDIIITDGTKQAAKQESVLSDVVEAFIAALYLDGGQKAADRPLSNVTLMSHKQHQTMRKTTRNQPYKNG